MIANYTTTLDAEGLTALVVTTLRSRHWILPQYDLVAPLVSHLRTKTDLSEWAFIDYLAELVAGLEEAAGGAAKHRVGPFILKAENFERALQNARL